MIGAKTAISWVEDIALFLAISRVRDIACLTPTELFLRLQTYLVRASPGFFSGLRYSLIGAITGVGDIARLQLFLGLEI